MTKNILFTLTVILFGHSTYGQSDIDSRVKAVEEKSKQLDDYFKAEIINIRQILEINNTKVTQNTAEVQKLTKLKPETDENKFQSKVTAFNSSSEFVKSANKSFKSIDVSLVQVTFLQDITNLNNPTNEDLGFSLKGVIETLINKHITSKDKSLNKAGRLNNFVNGILNNPITQIAKSAVPAINTVVSFLSNISFGSKKISEEDFNLFVKDLQVYIKHYEGLSNASNEFQSSLEQIKIRTKALEMILENYVTDRISDLYKDKAKLVRPYNIDNLYSTYFTKELIESQTKAIRKEYSEVLVQTLLDARMNPSMTTLTQARYIQDELEALTNQYINVHKTYLKNIIQVLNNSRQLDGADKEKIDKKILALTEQLTEWSSKFGSLVDIEDVKKQVKGISNSMTIY